MKKLIIASSNKHKIEEIKEMLKDLNISILSLNDINFTSEIEENGLTFKENSYIKAKTIYDIYKIPTLADDSGLSVDCLDGRPGVKSHRYAGKNATDKDNRELLKKELSLYNFKSFDAHFTTAMTYIDEYRLIQVEGYLFGKIILEEKGTNGFGYDSMFYSDKINKTLAEATEDEKNSISHRHDALIKLKDELLK